jgi:hypothetical protein
MKKIIYLLIPFLFLTTFSFSQTNYGPGHLIGGTYKHVKNKFKEYKYSNFNNVKYIDKFHQKYVRKDGNVENIYHFIKEKNRKYCYKTILITDKELGEKLIDNHIFYKKDWIKLTDSTYLYCSECYNLPVIAEVSYNDCNKIILEYNLKDN